MIRKKILIPGIIIVVAILAVAAFLIFSGKAGDIMTGGNEAKGLDIKIADKYLDGIGDSRQLVVVTAKEYFSSEATVRTYEKDGDTWKPVLAATPAVIGAAGFAAPGEKFEGDGRSPTGIFTFGVCFGNKPNPGTKMEYRQVTENDFWVDDPDSEYYNTWQTGPVDGKWKSAECLGLTGTAYDYAAVINYNTEKRTPGKGSAIFMHIWNGPSGQTAGCTAMAEETLVPVLKWFDPAKKPIIIQGVEEEIRGAK